MSLEGIKNLFLSFLMISAKQNPLQKLLIRQSVLFIQTPLSEVLSPQERTVKMVLLFQCSICQNSLELRHKVVSQVPVLQRIDLTSLSNKSQRTLHMCISVFLLAKRKLALCLAGEQACFQNVITQIRVIVN